MGADHSKHQAAECFDKPWRNIPWADKDSALQDVKSYKPHTEGQLLRILLHGPSGAGKSSFINSVQSVLHGRMYAHALADTSGSCFTKKYTTYKIPKGSPKTFYPFVFNDIRGLHQQGVLVDDVKLALMGHVKDGYTFNTESPLTDLKPNAFYNKHPTDNDKVHVLVCVVPADTASQATEETVKKIRNIRIEASKLGIPQVAILTKIDRARPEIKDDLKKVYEVKRIKEKMEQFSVDVGIPMNCIFPVWNYHEEIDLNNDVDSLILSSLKTIINFGDDYINFKRIPQVAIPTKVDGACPEIKDNLDKDYEVKYLKEKMEELRVDVGILKNSNLPVKNSHEESDRDGDSLERNINFNSQSEASDRYA